LEYLVFLSTVARDSSLLRGNKRADLRTQFFHWKVDRKSVSKKWVERKSRNLERKGQMFEEFYLSEELFDKTKKTSL